MSEYHPNFFEKNKSHRKDCHIRLKQIKKNIDNNIKIVDIGCSGGYYSFGLSEKCSYILAFDKEKDLIDKCNSIKDQYNIPNIDFKVDTLENFIKNTEYWDTIIYMSTHHHIIGINGFKKATDILKSLSQKSDSMIFDMGQQNENCTQHYWWKKLPTININHQRDWMVKYLMNNTDYNIIKEIGQSPIHGVHRFLWKLEK